MSLKQKIKNKEITIGSWLTIGNPYIAEIMLQAGFDWLVIDMEHTAITLTEAQRLIQVIELGGGVPLVRVTSNDSNIIKRVMDAGAHGVIVPMVNSRDEALQAVQSVKYPPVGRRGVGLGRAQKYGTGFEDYKNWLEGESVIIVQIENIHAVKNLESILSVNGVDGFLIGPYDLSGSLGMPGEFENSRMLKAMEQIKSVSRKLDAVSGIHVVQPKTELVLEKIDQGFKFIAFSLDSLFLAQTCISKMKNIRTTLTP